MPELDASFEHLLKLAQGESYPEEIKKLQGNKPVQKSSKIINLNPFLDERGLLRVGGRLVNSSFDFDKKHLIILAGEH
ncbi:hypothetical protein NQ317_004191 [Molorchus minor]|uniref:Uncharacterized protein n=1 Tax=Molorchus minor TaxID=1323400 RepID=A0ABQ9JE99_9CUCU|nr:hypothetical protein NQ317_004191 [Molorchus minor]